MAKKKKRSTKAKSKETLLCKIHFNTKPIDEALKKLEYAIGNIKITVN